MYSKSNSDYMNYTRIRNELRTMTRTLCATFEHQLVNDVKDNPKAFWNYARTLVVAIADLKMIWIKIIFKRILQRHKTRFFFKTNLAT